VKRGLVLGKFMPPHAGHVHLVDVARRLCDELTVVVDRLADEPIPGELRRAWLAEMFPSVRVVRLDDVNPQDPREHPDFWAIWRASLLRALGVAPDVVFASEAYGPTLAEVLGAAFVPIDPSRSAHAIRGTDVRRDPWRHWDALPRVVRPHFLRRVSIFGPESTGKSSLARALAERFGTVFVPEFARTLLESRGGACVADDMPLIARGQAAAEDALALDARKILVCDTDPLATCIWSEALFGLCAPEVRAVAAPRAYALTLLLDVDVPWVDDVVRYLPRERRSFFEACDRALAQAGRRVVTIRGSWDERLRTACAAIEALAEEAGWTP
jgi:NadR type nicotinamide-nucleotide adenylyltransferase